MDSKSQLVLKLRKSLIGEQGGLPCRNYTVYRQYNTQPLALPEVEDQPARTPKMTMHKANSASRLARTQWNRLLNADLARAAKSNSTRDWALDRRSHGSLTSDKFNHLARQCWKELVSE